MDYTTSIELVDTGNGQAHVARYVRVNGSPVRVAENGIYIEHSPNDVTRVHLELLPDEIHFVRDAKPEPTNEELKLSEGYTKPTVGPTDLLNPELLKAAGLTKQDAEYILSYGPDEHLREF